MKVRKLCVGLMLPVVLIAIIGLSMTACGDTADPTTINFPDPPTLESLPDFTLNTAVHPGGVLLTWDIVKDAAEYEVWRQDANGAVLLGTLSNQTKFADIKTRLNDLKAGDYKYTVIAVSLASPKKHDAPVPIYNSKAEKTVNFTAANLEVTLTPVSNLKLEVTPSNKVLATWDADANPLVSYEVFRNDDFYNYPLGIDAPYYTFELAGGYIADVSVRKILYKSKISGDFTCYNPLEYENAVITVFNPSAVQITADRDDKDKVKLTFSGVPSTGLASTFTLSRYQVAASATDSPDWTSVDHLPSARLMTDGDDPYYELEDTLPANTEKATFVYRLVGKYPGVNLLKSVVYVTLDPLYETLSLKTITLDAVKNAKAPAVPSTSEDNFETYYWLIHDIETEANYTYYMKQTSGANGIELPENEAYNWEPITIASADKLTSRTSQTVKVTVPAARTSYEFKVVATGTGSKAGYKGVEDTYGPVQFSDSITPADYSDDTIPEYFEITIPLIVSSANITIHGTRYTSASVSTVNVYSLNLAGLAEVGGDAGLMRANEILEIELLSDKGDPEQPIQSVSRTTSYVGAEGSTTSIGTNLYFFLVPTDRSGGDGSTTPLYTKLRLHVTAK